MPGLLSWVVAVRRGSKDKASDVFPGPDPNIRHPLSVFPSLHRVLWDQFPGFVGTTKVLRLPAAHPAALRYPSRGGTSLALVVFAPRRTSAPPRPGVDGPVSPAGMLSRKRQDLPSSWGTPIVRLRMFQTDAGGTACTRPLRYSSVAPERPTAKAPTRGLSTLHSMAFGLAVYASPGSLPSHDERLASSCWSGSTGRAFHPQGSDERFQSCRLHLIPLSQACLAQWARPPHFGPAAQVLEVSLT